MAMDEKHGISWLSQKVLEGKVMNPLDETDVAIIKGLANNGMIVSKAMLAAKVSRRTMYKRIEQIRQKTGCDPQDFFGLYKLFVFVIKTERKKDGKA